MKIIITESQYERLLGVLPPVLKRRITQEDMENIDRSIMFQLRFFDRPVYGKDFQKFKEDIIYDGLYDFISEYKSDEIDTEEDEEWGVVWTEESKRKIFDLYYLLEEPLKSLYNDKLYEIWKKMFRK